MGLKPLARRGQGRISATAPFREPISQHSPPMSQPSPGSSRVIQYCKGNRGIDEDSAILGSDSEPVPEAQQKGVTATTDSVANLLWFVRSSAA